MSYQKFVTIFAGTMSVLLLTAGFFTLTSMAPVRANFSGEWKLNVSESEFDDAEGIKKANEMKQCYQR